MERCLLSKLLSKQRTTTTQEPKRLKIGILGGSHAQGKQPYKTQPPKRSIFQLFKKQPEVQEKFTNPLEVHLTNAMPDFDFYNVAISGRGSERYVNNIIQLVEQYDIDAVIVDKMSNRSFNYFWYNEDGYNSLLEKDDAEISKTLSLYEEEFSTYAHRTPNCFIEPSVLNQLSPKVIQNWNKLTLFLDKSKSQYALGRRDMYNTQKLCEVYGIKYIEWSFNLELKPILEETFVDWNTITCDGHHINDLAMSWAADHYFRPKIFEALN